MAKRRRLTAEEIADRMTAIVMNHLDTLPAVERERRIRAFESHFPNASTRKGLRPKLKSNT